MVTDLSKTDVTIQRCKSNVPCLKVPDPSAVRQSDLPMQSPISQFLKGLAQLSELSAVSALLENVGMGTF